MISEYIQPFCSILRPRREKLHFFDPFCGTGMFEIDAYGKKIKFPGSPLIALPNTNKFDSYYFSDKDKKSVDILKERTDVCTNLNKIFENKTFVESLSYLDIIDSKDAVLAVVDPAGYSPTPWESVLKLLKFPTVDVLLTITAHGMHRNLNNKQDDSALRGFFGVDDDYKFGEIDDELYKYASKIKDKTGKGVLPLKINTVQNHYYYIFAISGSNAGWKILKYLRDKLNQISNDDLTRNVGKLSDDINTMDDYF